MSEANISNECKARIDKINLLVKTANDSLEEIKILNERVTAAENLLEKVKKTASQGIKEAYAEGYKKAKEENSGGNSENDDKKLELKD